MFLNILSVATYVVIAAIVIGGVIAAVAKIFRLNAS